MTEIRQDIGALDLMEEAIHFLRMHSGLLLSYYIGAMPFVLALLFFWSDMSRNGAAETYCAAASFGLTAVFVWMKYWQSVFSRSVFSIKQGGFRENALKPKSLFHLVFSQTFLHATGFIVIPIAVLATIPLPWAYAFYQNVCVQEDGSETSLREMVKKSMGCARVWPKQNTILFCFLILSGLFVFLNILVTLFFLPNLLKILFGMETSFTLSGWRAVLNTTFFATACCLTYLVMDPFVKCIYALRCFYTESIRTGDDLKAELSGFSIPGRAKKGILCLFIGMFLTLGNIHPTLADGSLSPSPEKIVSTNSVSPGQLDQAIRKVLEKRKFAWRLPRESGKKEKKEETGFISTFFNWIFDGIETIFDTISEGIKDFFKWIDKKISWKTDTHKKKQESDWRPVIRILLYVLLAIVTSMMAILLFRILKRKRTKKEPRIVETTPGVPDPLDENTCADEVPVDEWLELAKNMLEKGDFPQALRAYFMHTLALLADHRVITIAKYKSNREYSRELQRKAHNIPELPELFSTMAVGFDRAWYGLYPVSKEDVIRFYKGHEEVTRLVQNI